MASELGVNANLQPVAHYQNRRIAQCQAVAEQLLEGSVQVFAGRFVFSGKGTALEHIGITGTSAHHAVFFFEQIARFTAGLGYGQQLAQVNEVALCALLFIKPKGRAARTSFMYKFLGRDGDCHWLVASQNKFNSCFSHGLL